MKLKDKIIATLQACAEAAFANTQVGSELQRGFLRLGIGAPGNFFKLQGETREAGLAYPLPNVIDCLADALAETIGRRSSTYRKNAEGSPLLRGTAVRINTLGELRRAVSTNDIGFIGTVIDDIPVNAFGEVATSGEAPVLLEAGQAPQPSKILALSIIAGESVLTAVEADAFATIVSTTGFVDPSNRVVTAILALRPQA